MNKVLGLEFYKGSSHQAMEAAHGLCVFPSAPGLATLDRDTRYRQSLVEADTRYMDSGFLTLIWFLRSGQWLSRVSGLTFLRNFLAADELKAIRMLWVHPSAEALDRNAAFLQKSGIPPELSVHWVAPQYLVDGPLKDPALVEKAKETHPQVIVINLGSNIQEPLGAYLKRNLSYRPLILCTGGAIDFITGIQVPIPPLVDKLFLGWFWRIIFTPRVQASKLRVSPLRRYLKALRLVGLVMRWGTRLPQ